MMNRTRMPSLLRSRGGRTKSEDMVRDVKRKSGSLTHGSLTTEPSLKALGAKKSQVEYGLPHKSSRRSPKPKDDGIYENARLIEKRKPAKRFDEPHEFGPNVGRSAPKKDHFKTGGTTRRHHAHGGEEHLWIQGAIKKPGALRKTLHVKAGEKIPEAKLMKAEHSRNPLTRKRARLAETLRGFHH